MWNCVDCDTRLPVPIGRCADCILGLPRSDMRCSRCRHYSVADPCNSCEDEERLNRWYWREREADGYDDTNRGGLG